VAAKCSFLVEKIQKIIPSLKSEVIIKNLSKEELPDILKEE
jgi:cellobiose-specific phosphotransferase system component IIB